MKSWSKIVCAWALSFGLAAGLQAQPRSITNNYGGYFAYNTGEDASQYPEDAEGVSKRHVTGAVIAGFDGRALFISLDKFREESSLPGPGLLWCKPGRADGH